MNKLKPCLIDRNKIPFKELWREARCFADDIVCAVGTDFMQKIEEAEYQAICDLLNRLQQMEVVDAEPVVRCKDCKFGDWDSEPNDAMVCMRTKDGFWRSGNDFCSFGERKEGADNV